MPVAAPRPPALEKSAALRAQDYFHDIPHWTDITPEQVASFKSHWNDLVLDENFKQSTTRHRRILRYFYTHPGQFSLNTDADYVPPVSYDADYTQGVNHLTYATPEFIADPVTQRVLHEDLAVLDHVLERGANYAIDIDLFRVSASHGTISPTTAGYHQDGQDWLFMHFVDAKNIRPVVSKIAAVKTAQNPLIETPMTAFLETLCVNDQKLFHAAGPVVQLCPDKPAQRDILLVSVTRSAPLSPTNTA